MPMTREEATEVRKLTYEDLEKSKRHAFQLHGDYGKWLIASLLLVHGAAIAFLAQNGRLSKAVLPLVFWWHVTGIIFAFLCGFLAWANWGFHIRLYEAAKPGMIYENEDWPRFNPITERRVDWTLRLSIVAGVASTFCILCSALRAYRVMTTPSSLLSPLVDSRVPDITWVIHALVTLTGF